MSKNPTPISEIEDLIGDIDYHFQMYNAEGGFATTRVQHLIELGNCISQLKTWHSEYDYNSGTLGWERDDQEFILGLKE